MRYYSACSAQQTSDDGYVLAGGTQEGLVGKYDSWMVKLEGEEKTSGNFTPEFEVFGAMCSFGVIGVIFILRQNRV